MKLSATEVVVFATVLVFTAGLVGTLTAQLLASIRHGRRIGLHRHWSVPQFVMTLLIVSLALLSAELYIVTSSVMAAINKDHICTVQDSKP